MRERLSRRGLLRTGALAGVVGVAGCSGDPLRAVTNATPDWRVDVDGATGVGPPAIHDGTVHVGATDRGLHGLDAADGSRRFRVETGGPVEARPVTPSEGSGPDVVHVHSTDGDVYGVTPDGEHLWTAEGVPVRGTLVRAGSCLCELDYPADRGPNRLAGYDARTGERRFRTDVAAYRPPATTPERVVVPVPAGDERERLVAFDAAGEVAWRTDPERYASDQVADGDLLVGFDTADDEGRVAVVARDAAGGTVRWRTEAIGDPLPSRLRPSVHLAGDRVYVPLDVADVPTLVALDGADGSVTWRRTFAGRIHNAVAADAGAYVASRDRTSDEFRTRIDAFDPDGTRRWTSTIDRTEVDELVAVGDAVVVNGGTSLVAFDVASGVTRWSYDPTSSGGIRVATGTDGVVASQMGRGVVVRLPA